jgi:CheY-like chemotaxis protein
MDVQMPEMNGYEATVAIRELVRDRHIPIIALTAGNVKGEKDKCLAAGMDDFVAKPFVEDAIWQVLNKYTAISSGTQVPEINHEIVSEIVNPHFDIEKLNSVYMNDQEFISEFLALTKEGLIKNMSDLKQAYQLEKLDSVKAAGHKLKGASAAAYLTRVTEIAANLEHLDSFNNNLIRKLLEELEEEIELLIPLMSGAEN